MRARRPVVALTAAALLAAALWVEPVRTAAGEFLDVFRVKRLQVVNVTPRDLARLRDLMEQGGTAHLESLGSVEVKGQAQSRQVTKEEAARALGFPLRLPDPGLLAPYATPVFWLDQIPTVSLTLNVSRVNSFLRSLGGRDLLPPSLEGRTFTVTGSPTCRVTWRGQDGELILVQGRAPELQVPPDVDVAALRAALLGIPGLPENLRRQLASIADWQHTLPVPALEGVSRRVTVNGSPGVFWSPPGGPRGAGPAGPGEGGRTQGGPTQAGPAQGGPAEGVPVARPPATLFWEEGGVLYVIEGRLSLEQALELAGSLAPR